MTDLLGLPIAGWLLTAVILVFVHFANKHGAHEDYGSSESGWFDGGGDGGD